MSVRVQVELGERAYPVVVGAGGLDQTGHQIVDLGRPGPLLVVTDETVARLWRPRLEAALEVTGAAGWGPISWLELPPGEPHKNLEQVTRIWERGLDLGADRQLLIVAFGGGVVGDMAGFAAATLLRGVRLLMLPTTLLAQVDSSVGGKTGFNSAQGKNLIGAFHQPSAVIADLAVLRTLPERDFRAGFAEIIKIAAVQDEELFDRLYVHAPALLAQEPAALAEVVARCCALKAAVVAADEREAGARQLLTFGHTVGHAIEKLGAYSRWRHGEAVAMGMIAAARIGAAAGVADEGVHDRLLALVARFGLPTAPPPDTDRAALIAAMGFDKKRRGGAIRWILCPRIGHWVGHELTAEEAVAALD